MAGKGLGAGLGALFGEAAASAAENAGSQYLPIAKIEPRRDQPRTNFDGEALAELAESIREHGVIQPLTVRSTDGGHFQIIAGERRWRAARMAGLSEVPVCIIRANDRKATELALVENLQRENLNAMEEACGYKRLMEEYGLTQEETAEKVGKSRPVIANAVRLLSLPEDVQRLVESGKLSLSHARAILEIPDQETRSRAATLIIEKSMTVRDAEAMIKKLLARKPEKKPAAKPEVDYVAEAEKALAAGLGRKVRILSGKKRGQLVLEYYGSEDFERLYDALLSMRPSDGGNKH